MRRALLTIAIIGLFLTPGCVKPQRGILLMAHGGDPSWNEQVEQVVSPLRSRQPVEVAYGMATTSTLRDAVKRLEARGVHEIAVVRMFISGESFLLPTEFILGLRSDLPPDPHGNYLPPRSQAACHEGKKTAGGAALASANSGSPHGSGAEPVPSGDHHCMEPPERIAMKAQVALSREGVADSTLVDQILVDRVKALSRHPHQESVLILGHGPGDDRENERWLEKMRARARGVERLGPFREVRCETLREDWPERRSQAEQRIRAFVHAQSRDGGRVIVVPFRVAGFGPYKEVLQGLNYVSDGLGFCPHPNMTQWIAETATACFEQSHKDVALAGSR
jgi:hypothetical protein